MGLAEDLFSLRGKVVVIIGATGLLGTEYVKTVAAAGGVPVVVDVNKDRCIQLAGEVNSAFRCGAFALPANILSEDDIVWVFEQTVEHFGKVDALVNNAQVKPEGFYAPFEKYTKETLMTVVDGNLVAVVLSCRQACLRFAEQGYGTIVNVASTYGLVGADQRIYDGVKNIYFPEERFSSPVSYAITKAGIVNLTRYLAAYYRGTKIRVNCLTPGGVYESHDEQFTTNYSYRTILGRMADKTEYNGALLYLLSEASSYMNGANLVVDGGWTAL
jgi:2-deoxy-D-gluconate 3-dehydrogenase